MKRHDAAVFLHVFSSDIVIMRCNVSLQSSLCTQVVSKVVRRQNLADGMGGKGVGGGDGGGDNGPVSMYPLSSEERDVRMAEVQSLGVDLANDMVVTLLR